MAYNVTGTNGNDTLNQASDVGPGTVVGLAGDDCIFSGSGLLTIVGDSGNDTVALRTGNTGTVNGGTENDSISDNGTDIGPMLLFGGDGADRITTTVSTANQTIVGGNDSNDGADIIGAGPGNDFILGNGGDDLISDFGGNDTVVGGFGNDVMSIFAPGTSLVFANQGNDVFTLFGNGTAFAGQGNDVFTLFGSGMAFGNEGNDVFTVFGPGSTLVGGNDSADGDDNISAIGGTSIVFGNGGNDIIGASGNSTVIGGFGNDNIGADRLIFANEGNDTITTTSAAANTVFGGLGNDTVLGNTGAETFQGNENNDTIRGGLGIDTISGGTGNDVFAYTNEDEDGNNAAGGGPVELITDVDFAVDRFRTDVATVTFATNTGAGTGADLNASANNAIAAAFALNGGAGVVAAQFTFGGRTYLAIDQAVFGTFLDTDDLLLDITGATGSIATSNFI